MKDKLRDKKLDELFQAVLELKTVDECYDFFEDLCTVTELKAMEQRFQVALLLSNGEPYSSIVAKTGASTATISRVSRSLNFGNDGYVTIIERIRK